VFGQESRIRNKLQAGYIWIILGWKHLSALETSVDMNEVEAQSTGAETPYYIYIYISLVGTSALPEVKTHQSWLS
jgi:hypothetical protein